jgi:hypothetical protein
MKKALSTPGREIRLVSTRKGLAKAIKQSSPQVLLGFSPGISDLSFAFG